MAWKASSTGFGSLQVKLRNMENAGKNSVHSVDIGIVKSARYPRKTEHGRAPSVAQVAVWNEFGTRGGKSGGGWGGPSPPRPFMRNAMTASKKDDRIGKILKTSVNASNPKIDEQTAGRIGAVVHSNMIEAMQDSDLAPNAPLTIKLKGSSKPLHDTGLLRRSLAWKVNRTEPQDDDAGFKVG